MKALYQNSKNYPKNRKVEAPSITQDRIDLLREWYDIVVKIMDKKLPSSMLLNALKKDLIKATLSTNIRLNIKTP